MRADAVTDKNKAEVKMVGIGHKRRTVRLATACGSLFATSNTLKRLMSGRVDKGDAISTARVAAILAAKNTSNIVPLCHPLPLERVELGFELKDNDSRLEITATVETSAKTGVEMEALTAVSVAALTLYDMCKSIERSTRIGDVYLVFKSGGKSGDYSVG